MKLRLEDNTLRLRLSAADVQQFGQHGRVAVTVPLGPGPTDQLTYTLEHAPDPAATAPGLAYTAGRLAVQVPAALAAEWLDSEQVGFSHVIKTTASQELRILVEKDLGCKH